MTTYYNSAASKRPVNLSLNEDLVRKVRETTGNLSEHVEMLLAAALDAEMAKRSAADALLAETLAYWNEFDAEHGSFADEFSSL